MTDVDTYEDMPLTKSLKDWLTSKEWNDEIEIDEGRKASRVQTVVGIENQGHKLFLEVKEDTDRFSVYMYSPFNVSPAKMPEMARVLNRINISNALGRLACSDDDDANPVQFHSIVDVEGGALSVTQIDTMVSASIHAFERYGELLAAVALTKQSGNALWKSFLKEQAAASKVSEDAGPSEL